MRGWTSSNSTDRRRDRAFQLLADAHGEVISRGHNASAEPLEPASFYVAPSPGDALTSFDAGVADALRRHLADQGLTSLSRAVDDLETLGRRVRRREESDHSVSAVVYQMH